MKAIDKYIIERILISKGMEDPKPDIYDATKFSVGDIVVAVYQYNSRHVHFYKIKCIKGQSFTMVELEKKKVSGDWQNGSCLPTKEEIGEEVIAKLSRTRSRSGGKQRLKYKDYFCYLFTGDPEDYYTD